MMAAGMLAATSCPDVDDYNEAPSGGTADASKTLWENISQNPDLSDFVALVKRTGFDAELGNTRSYTVWAPVNGSFAMSDYETKSDSLVLQQFVKSHVAQYVHGASGEVDERIHALNEKSFTFTGNGSYSYAGQEIGAMNLPSSNGVLHTLKGMAMFYPNLYEYIFMGEDINMLRNEFLRYQESYLDTQNSVKGPVVNGNQTYIDSVIVTNNSLVNRLNARLSNEDSTYTFLMPNDKAYQDYYDRIKPYYKFIDNTLVQDVENFTKANDTKTKTANLATLMASLSPATPDNLTDSLTRQLVVNNLVYSNNDAYNRWMIDKGPYTDTLRTTRRNKFSNPKELLEPVVKKVPMSNGTAYIMDSLAFLPWETYNPEIEINPLNYTYSATYTDQAGKSKNRFDFSTSQVRVPDSLAKKIFGPEATEFRFELIKSTNEYSPPEIYISLPNVLSTTYQVYVVFMPWRIETSNGYAYVASDNRPNILNFELNYCDEKGKAAKRNFTSKDPETNATKLARSTAFINNTEVADTIYLGNVTFPVAYKGLPSGYTPNLHISSPYDAFDDDDVNTYTTDVRIAKIILRPLEMVELEEKQK